MIIDTESPAWDDLKRFLDCAGAEGYVLAGVDAGELYIAIYGYPEEFN